MSSDTTNQPDELDSAIAQGGFHRLRPEYPEGERDPFFAWARAPHWVPRTGYALPTRQMLEAVEAGLKAKL